MQGVGCRQHARGILEARGRDLLDRPLTRRGEREDRRPEAAHADLCGVFEQLATLAQLGKQTVRPDVGERHVAKPVQRDLVPAVRDTPHEIRLAARGLADDEHRRPDPALLDELEEAMAHGHESGLLRSRAAVVLEVERDGHRHKLQHTIGPWRWR